MITGVGVVSPIGVGTTAFWESLTAHRSGIKSFSLVRDTAMPVQFGGTIIDFEAKQHVKPRKSLKVMSREIQTGFAAASLAMGDATLDPSGLDPERFGVVYGSEMLYAEVGELKDVYRNCLAKDPPDLSYWGQCAMSDLNPLWMLKYLPNMPACHIGIAHDARGHNNTITLGDASSLLALMEAARVIERGHADVMICGGTGSRLSLTPLLYRGDSNLSHRGDDPTAAPRPFDAARDGMVNGEGAGALVLESRAHARARGARVLAEIAGCGCGYEPPNGARNPGSGLRRAIERAMSESNIGVAELDHVNARGLSTVSGDMAEAQAIQETLGDVPVTAPKSFFGHLGAGTGAVEIAASVLALDRKSVPVTLNYDQPDPRCPVNVICQQAKPCTQPAVIALNQAGTGQAVAVVLLRA